MGQGQEERCPAVLDASDYELPISEMLADMEFTVVHELVHLELASLPRSEASRSSEEQPVNRIAEALSPGQSSEVGSPLLTREHSFSREHPCYTR